MSFKKIGVPLVALTMVLITLIVASVFVAESSWGTKRIAEYLSSDLDREVHIGEIELGVSKTLALNLRDLRVANAAWANESYFLSVETIKIELGWWDLLQGRAQMHEVRAGHPIVNLQINKGGKRNWEFAVQENTVAQNSIAGTSGDRKRSVLDVSDIHTLDIKGGLLSYIDLRTDTNIPMRFNAHAGIGLANGIIKIAGEGMIAGEKAKIDISSDLPISELDLANGGLQTSSEPNFQISASIDTAKAKIQLSGHVDQPLNPKRALLTIGASGRTSALDLLTDTPFPFDHDFRLQTELTIDTGQLCICDFSVKVASNDVSGEVLVQLNGNSTRLERGHFSSNLRSELIVVDEFMSPSNQDERSSSLEDYALDLTAILTDLRLVGQVDYSAKELRSEFVNLTDVNLIANLRSNTLDATLTSSSIGDASIRLAASQSKRGRKLSTYSLSLQWIAMELESIADKIARVPGWLVGVTDGEMAIDIDVKHTQGPSTGEGTIADVVFSGLELDYRHSFSDGPLSLTVTKTRSLVNSGDLKLVVDGHWDKLPVAGKLDVAAIAASLLPDIRWSPETSIEGQLSIGETTVTMNIHSDATASQDEVALQFKLESAKPGQLLGRTNVSVSPMSPIAFDATVRKDGEQWTGDDIALDWGNTNAKGAISVTAGHKPNFDIKLDAKTIDFPQLLTFFANVEPAIQAIEAQMEPVEDLVDAAPLSARDTALRDISGDISFNVDRLILPGLVLDDITVNADMQHGEMAVSTLNTTFAGGKVSTRAKIDLPTESGVVNVEASDIDLATVFEKFNLPTAVAPGTIGLAATLSVNGKSNQTTQASGEFLDRLRIEKLDMSYTGPLLENKFTIAIPTTSLSEQLRAYGKTKLNGRRIDIELTTGPIEQLFVDYETLPIHAVVKHDKTKIVAHSTMNKLLPVESLTVDLSIEGDDPVKLSQILGVGVPSLPPYKLSAVVTRGGNADSQTNNWHANAIEGVIGDSDIAGELTVSFVSSTPEIVGKLRSRLLDLDDLGTLVGAAPDPTETASIAQKLQAEKLSDQKKILPSKIIDLRSFATLDADIAYSAKRIQANSLPFDDVELTVLLRESVLLINEMKFGIAEGGATINLEIDPREKPTRAKFSSHFDNLQLNDVVGEFDVGNEAFGLIGGKATFWMLGESVAQFFASADGGMYLTMTGGEIDALLVELAGLDFIESMAVLIGEDTGVPIECAYMDMQVRKGVAQVDPLLIDTRDTKYRGTGSIDFRDETFDLKLMPFPQDFSLISMRGPLFVEGSFRTPGFRVEPSFPFPEFGDTEDSALCSGLIESLRDARKDQQNHPSN